MSCLMAVAGLIINWTRRTSSTEEGARKEIARAVEADPVPAGFKTEQKRVAFPGGSCDVIVVHPRPSPKAALLSSAYPNRAVIYLHGGAYLRPVTKYHWTLIGRIADEAGVKVFVPLYPRAPHYTYEHAYAFLHKAYEQVVAEMGGASAAQIALVGDSAGGGLALGFAQDVIAKGVSPRPSRVVLLAPWLCIKLSNPAIAAVNDPWLHPVGLRVIGAAWAAGPKASPDFEDNYRLSPLRGPMAGLPPIDVFVGTRDILYPDCLVLHRNAEAAGVTINLHVCAGAIHVYPILPSFVPEARAGAQEVVDVIKRWVSK